MQLRDFLSFDDIVIQCHDFPDADAIASGYGVYCYLKANGKNPRLIYSGSAKISKPNLMTMIKRLRIPVEYVETLERPELLISVDCAHGEKNITPFKAENYAVIDHHASAETSFALSEVRSNYGSCSTVIAGMLKNEGFDFNGNQSLATALYYGLYTDTKGFTEVSHPADRDLRDFTAFDKGLISLLINSNLSLPELKIAANALNNAVNAFDKRFAVVAAKSCDPNILGFINDIVLQVDSVDVCVVCCPNANGLKLSVRSCVDDVRATDLVDFITEGIGSGGGHIKKAGGFIRRDLIPAKDYKSPKEFLLKKVNEYYDSYDTIRVADFRPEISEMKRFVKLPDVTGFVRTADIVPAGTHIVLRTGEADISICAGIGTYIIVGRNGASYLIDKDKFDITYTPCDEVFEIDAEYNPKIITEDADIFDITPYARLCKSIYHAPVYAKELKRSLKLYTLWDSANYTLGKKGDYLAVRTDDLQDVYIITREMFKNTYIPYEK